MSKPFYRITEAGRRALESKDAAVPSDYRFILWLISADSHERLDNFMQQFPQQRLWDLLAEMDELGLIARTPGAPSAGDAEVEAAREALSRYGVYLSEDRLRGRPALAKTPPETVILIVEDDPDQLALAELRVSMAGYAVRLARNHALLLRSLRERMPDLLLLDVMLPDGDGFEILAKLRWHPAYRSLPIVLLTVKNDPDDIVRGLTLGADGYITKPYSKRILADVVRRVLQP
jgi:CheY-like chemotaxis protein